ncbi:MAG: arylesterase [Gammaproteobacteria bacterium]|nr:arylesterase [Gammaproteobacteria bacterium]MBU1777633.1 arylesterase [Gammaproteobacteria bacterium]MBU1969857.1 arylesterase [Gammaproteobacteria bacterium]
MSTPCQYHRSFGLLRHFILLFATVALLSACGSKEKMDVLPSGSRVLALGDSLTEGNGVAPEQAWPALLAEKTGWDVSNGGVSGDTSEAALRRLPGLLERHDPVLVLITLGGNDMLRRIPQQQTVANLEKIIALVREHGAQPLLLATPQPSVAGAVFQNLSDPDFYREIADTQQVALIENAMSDVLSDPQLKVDQLHPNAAGHALFTEKLLEELKRLGLVL